MFGYTGMIPIKKTSVRIYPLPPLACATVEGFGLWSEMRQYRVSLIAFHGYLSPTPGPNLGLPVP